jgi:plastocyanin
LRTARKLCALGALVALVVVGLAPTSAHAQSTLEVDIAAFFFDQGVPGEGMRFYAPTLKVHKGDTVKFNNPSFHTATLLPANTDVHGWVPDNAGGVGKPWSLFTVDPDDTALDPGGSSPDRESLKANNQALFPTSFVCGEPGNPCNYDGSSVLNSGAPQGPDASFSAVIDSSVGDTVWVICLVHPHMRLRIKVVNNATPTTTQAEIDAYRDSVAAADSEEAATLHKKLSDRKTKHTTSDGDVVWDAFVGYDSHWFTLYAMYPQRLNIRRGQTVRFHFAQLVYEDHTATFPASKARPIAGEAFQPSCDPDGDGGAGPDTPPDAPPPLFCSGGPSQLEFDIQPKFAYEQGNGVFRRSDYENSGVLGASAAVSTAPWDLRFSRTSGREPFKYICMIHPFMRGRVAVKPAHH